jgi:hypothetical protein
MVVCGCYAGASVVAVASAAAIASLLTCRSSFELSSGRRIKFSCVESTGAIDAHLHVKLTTYDSESSVNDVCCYFTRWYYLNMIRSRR